MLHARDPSASMLRALDDGTLTERAAPTGVGYTNLFGRLTDETVEDDGAWLSDAEVEDGGGKDSLFVRLGRLLETPYPWRAPAADGLDLVDNPRIPAGYTYLAQLVAHDLTFLGSSLPPMEEIPAEQANLRRIALDLETIYGGGPLERPSSFCPVAGDGPRTKLRLGMVRGWAGRPKETWPGLARDLPRAACPATLDAAAGPGDGLSEVLVADPRNDDHMLVAQTAVLFHLLHNEVCERLGRAPDAVAPDGPHLAERERDVFAASRRVVAAVFRDIVRDDLLGRLLCGPVHRHYRDRPGAFLDPAGGDAMPVEFSHAAFRIGHAMVRPGYKIRTDATFDLDSVLRFSSSRVPSMLPPRRDWIVLWSRFYAVGDGQAGAPGPNLSRRLAPSYTRTLATSPLIAVKDDRDDPTLHTGLSRRDLLRGGATRMRSVGSLIGHVRIAAPGLVAGSPLLRDADPGRRQAAVRAFLDRADGSPNGLTADEKALVAADPPLLLFLLIEAAIEQDGLCLGVLGSVIVGEVVFRALAAADEVEAARTPGTATLAAAAFGDGAAAPRSMPALLGFLGALPSLAGADPSFM